MKEIADRRIHEIAERRKEERFAKWLTADLFDGRKKLLVPAVQLKNISMRGICFESPVSLNPCDVFHFQMGIPGHGQVVGTGHVRWIEPIPGRREFIFGAEVQFMRWEYASRLHRYIQPHSFDLLFFLDIALKGACCVVAFLVLWNILHGNANLYR